MLDASSSNIRLGQYLAGSAIDTSRLIGSTHPAYQITIICFALVVEWTTGCHFPIEVRNESGIFPVFPTLDGNTVPPVEMGVTDATTLDASEDGRRAWAAWTENVT